MKDPVLLDPRAPDPYTVLGLTRSALADDIKRAYFAQVRAHPPEREPARFKEIRAAYERLKTPEAKLETDMLRAEEWMEPALSAPEPIDAAVDPADVIRAARACSDLGRHDWREDWREVKL